MRLVQPEQLPNRAGRRTDAPACRPPFWKRERVRRCHQRDCRHGHDTGADGFDAAVFARPRSGGLERVYQRYVGLQHRVRYKRRRYGIDDCVDASDVYRGNARLSRRRHHRPLGNLATAMRRCRQRHQRGWPCAYMRAQWPDQRWHCAHPAAGACCGGCAQQRKHSHTNDSCNVPGNRGDDSGDFDFRPGKRARGTGFRPGEGPAEPSIGCTFVGKGPRWRDRRLDPGVFGRRSRSGRGARHRSAGCQRH